MESFSTCKKLHLETIGMANFSKWKYWSDRGFPYTRQQCELQERCNYKYIGVSYITRMLSGTD